MASLKGKCKPSRNCFPGVMKTVPTTIWLSKSFRQPPLTAICNHQQSFSSTDRWKSTSSHHQVTQQWSCQSIPQSQTGLQQIWCLFQGETWPPTNPANLGTWYYFQKMESRCGQIPSCNTPFPHHPHTTRWIQGKPLVSERGCNTNHNSRVSEYNVQY